MLRSLRRVLAVAAVLSVAGACVAHEAEPAFRASVLIDDIGISIPLPPPSLIDAPEQEVEVEGSVIGLSDGADDIVVRIVDNQGQADVEVALAAGDTQFKAEGVAIDLTDNCLEVWLEDGSGAEGDHELYHTVIDESDQTVSVVQGCD